jgi:hypothetical protein
MSDEQAPNPELKPLYEFTITCSVDADGKAHFSFKPAGDGIQPFDCIQLCPKGLAWAIAQQNRVEQMAADVAEKAMQERVTGEKRTEGGIILPGVIDNPAAYRMKQ